MPADAPLESLQPSWKGLGVKLLLWTLLILALWGLMARLSWEERRGIALNRARDGYQKDLLYRQWATERGGVYVPLDEKTPANPYLAHLPDREIRGSNGKTYTLVNPAYMTRMVHELGQKMYGIRGHITSLNPIRPGNAPDAWERKVLELFEQGRSEYWEAVTQGDRQEIRYMGAFKVTEGCLRCHAHQGYRVGDVRGGISVTVPLEDPHWTALGRHEAWIFVLLGSFWAVGVATLLVVFRRDRRHAEERHVALNAVLEERQLYQSLVEELPMALYRTDTQDRLVHANPAFLRAFGCGDGAVEGKALATLLPPDLARQHVAEHGRVLDGEVIHRTERRGEAEGERWLEIIKLPVRSVDGAVTGIQGIAWDITERFRGEQRQRAAAERHRAMVEATRDGFIQIDAEGRIQACNEILLQWLGHAREELVGQPVGILDAEADEARVGERLARIRTQGWDRFETRLRRRDGSTLEVEASISHLNEGGGATLGFLRDIGEEKATLQRLAESEQRFRTLLETLPLPLFVQQEGRFVYANPAGLDLLRVPDLQGLEGADILAFVHPDDRATVAKRILEALQQMQRVSAMEHRLLRSDGTVFPGEVEGIPVSLWGRPAIVVFAQDLSRRRAEEAERRRMEDELQHAQRMESLGHLAGGIAHDMNNVLAAILGLGTALRLKAAGDPSLGKAMNTIVHAAERGRELVKGLTEFARKGRRETCPVDLNAIVRAEEALLNRTTLQKVEVILELTEPLPSILGDPHALGNALMNLCLNALDAMPEGGILRVGTSRVGRDIVELSVADTGLGMAPEVVEHALEPFFTTKPVGKGTGLGLSVVYGTVKSHGGQVEITSTPGQGTRITLRFPVLPDQAGAEARPAVLNLSPARSLSILLVDDDALVRGTVPEMLSVLGHHAETAAGGPEALERLQAGLQVDLVILDLNMPGMGGLETLQHLRRIRPELPVLIASGYKDATVDQVLARFDRVEVLMKPYSLEECQAVLGRLG